jgi:hypothetical protein
VEEVECQVWEVECLPWVAEEVVLEQQQAVVDFLLGFRLVYLQISKT